MQSQVRFNRVPEKVPEKVLGGFGAEPGQVQQGSGEGSGEGLGGFGAEPGQVQQGSGEGSGGWGGFGAEPGQVQQGEGSGEDSGEGVPEKVWRLRCRARSSSTGFQRRFRRRFWEALVQSQVRFNRVPENVPEKVWEALVQSQVTFNRVPEKVPAKVPEVGEALVQNQVRFNREKVPEKIPEKEFRRRSGGFGAEPGQVQQGSREGSVEGSRRLWCRARSRSTGFRRRFRTRFWEALLQSQVRFNRVPEKEFRSSG